MKFIYLPDVHATNRKENRKDNFLDIVVSKLKFVLQQAKEHKVDFIICVGDLFNSPDVGYAVTSRIADTLNAGIPIYSAIGSHDHYNYQFSTLHRTPLGVLRGSGLIKVPEEPVIIGNCAFYFSHHSHTIDRDANELKVGKVKDKNAQVHIHIIHGALYPEQLPGNYVLLKDYPNEFMDLVLAGHIHHPFSWFDKKRLIRFLNTGSLLRCKRDENHEPKIALIEITGTEIVIEEIEVPFERDVFIEMEETLEQVDSEFKSLFEIRNLKLDGFSDPKELIRTHITDQDIRNEMLGILEKVNAQ